MDDNREDLQVLAADLEQENVLEETDAGSAPAEESGLAEVAVPEPEPRPEWYRSLSLEDADAFIRSGLQSAARNVIAIGYYLKHIRDHQLYQEAGYDNIWDYAGDQYGFSKSTASRYMSRNDKFSEGGNSPIMAEQYRAFGKSQLQEMLSLDADQLEQVTPDMTVQQIREMKRPKEIPYFEIEGQTSFEQNFPEIFPALPAPEPAAPPSTPGTFTLGIGDLVGGAERFPAALPEPVTASMDVQDLMEAVGAGEAVATSQQEELLSAYGTPVRVYPPDSLLTTSGCEGGHDCFLCAMECGIRQQDRYCRDAPLGNPFPCEIVKSGFQGLGDWCQFVNHDLAHHREGDHEPVPCCKDCQDPCEYICSRAMEALDAQKDIPAGNSAGPEPEKSDMDLLREMLKKENELLSEFLKVDKVEKLPGDMIRKKKLLVGALAGMLCDLENADGQGTEQAAEQPELPALKNNDQRKEWLRNYRDWGLWYIDENIGVKYYKYDFKNGARLIVEENTSILPHGGEYTTSFFHLVGGPEPPRHPTYGFGKWSLRERYSHHPDSETELVEFLKEVQRK